MLIKTAAELLDYSRGEEGQVEEVCSMHEVWTVCGMHAVCTAECLKYLLLLWNLLNNLTTYQMYSFRSNTFHLQFSVLLCRHFSGDTISQ